MKPETWLTKEGKKYFNRLVNVLAERGIDKDEYGLDLSILSQEYAKYEEAQSNAKKINPKTKEPYGWIQTFDNGTSNINAFQTVSDKALANIKHLSPKFGLTPKDFAAIGGTEKQPDKPKSGSLGEMIASRGGKKAG